MDKFEGITYLLENNRIRELHDDENIELSATHHGYNAEGIRVRVIDRDIHSILPATRLLMPELTRKNMGIFGWVMLIVVVLVVISFFFLLFSSVKKMGGGEMGTTPVSITKLPAMPNLEKPADTKTETGETLPVVEEDTYTLPPVVVEEQKINDLKNEYAMIEKDLSLELLQSQYDRLQATLDKVKADLDMCESDRQGLKDSMPSLADVDAGKKLRAYCTSTDRSEEEKIICSRLFFNF